jgi:dynein heavy chain, axonemal
MVSVMMDSPCLPAGLGWNMNYPFNAGDLVCSAQCACSYLDNNAKV